MGLPTEPSVLATLAGRYRKSRAGRTGQADRDFRIDYEKLLRAAGSSESEPRVCAERDLADAEAAGIVRIERNRRTGLFLTVLFSSKDEEALFSRIGQAAPATQRASLADLFIRMSDVPCIGKWEAAWRRFCQTYAEQAKTAASIPPFDGKKPNEIEELLCLLPRLLVWEGESHLRFASCLLCGESKRLEALQAKLAACLEEITEGKISSLADVGILPNERSLLIHGPLRLVFEERDVDLGILSGPARIDRRDLERARLQTEARRCVTVENAAMLHELAKLQSGVLLASSGSEGGFAHSAVITFLTKLPAETECWHFGDADPKGFAILQDLRKRSSREIHSLHMQYRPSPSAPLTAPEKSLLDQLVNSSYLTMEEKRQIRVMRTEGNKGLFEQESLGVSCKDWPFFKGSIAKPVE